MRLSSQHRQIMKLFSFEFINFLIKNTTNPNHGVKTRPTYFLKKNTLKAYYLDTTYNIHV